MDESQKKKTIDSAAAREEKLAAALRENLIKRKEQIKARTAALHETDPTQQPAKGPPQCP